MDSFSLSDLAETNESISSIKIIEFLCYLAYWNTFLTCFSDSPTYLDIISEGLILKNTEFDSVAQAFAKKVLPVPGGPYKSIPFHGQRMPLKIEGNFIGKIIEIQSYSLAFSNPAISSH